MDDRNHQTFRHGAGLRSSAPQMGGRAYFRMARSLSQARKGFRSDNRQRRCLGIRCAHPNPYPATRKSLKANAIIMSRTLSPGARVFPEAVLVIADKTVAGDVGDVTVGVVTATCGAELGIAP